MKFYLTTSIDRLWKAGACTGRFAHLLKSRSLVDREADLQERDKLQIAIHGLSAEQRSAPINLVEILDSNGLEDAAWAIWAIEQPERWRFSVLLIVRCLSVFEPYLPESDRPRFRELLARVESAARAALAARAARADLAARAARAALADLAALAALAARADLAALAARADRADRAALADLADLAARAARAALADLAARAARADLAARAARAARADLAALAARADRADRAARADLADRAARAARSKSDRKKYQAARVDARQRLTNEIRDLLLMEPVK